MKLSNSVNQDSFMLTKYSYTVQILGSNGKATTYKNQMFTSVNRGDTVTICGYSYEVIAVQHIPTKDPILHCKHFVGGSYYG